MLALMPVMSATAIPTCPGPALRAVAEGDTADLAQPAVDVALVCCLQAAGSVMDHQIWTNLSPNCRCRQHTTQQGAGHWGLTITYQ
jgi:hypothetical protein